MCPFLNGLLQLFAVATPSAKTEDVCRWSLSNNPQTKVPRRGQAPLSTLRPCANMQVRRCLSGAGEDYRPVRSLDGRDEDVQDDGASICLSI